MKSLSYIKSFLEDNFELSEIEVSIYLALLKQGKLTILEISRATDIHRSTVHLNVENLRQAGLVTQTTSGRGRKRYIIAESPERFEQILKNKERELQKTEEHLNEILPNLQNLMPQSTSDNGVSAAYYEGRAEVRRIYEDVLEANDIRSYVNAGMIVESLEMSQSFTPQLIGTHNQREDMYMKELMSKSEKLEEFGYMDKMNRERYKHKYMPESLNIGPIDYLIYDGKVAIVTKDKQMEGVIFENRYFFDVSKALFDYVWESIQ